MHHLYAFVSQKGGGVGEKRLVFVSKNISVFTDDPLVHVWQIFIMPRSALSQQDYELRRTSTDYNLNVTAFC